MHLLRKPKNGRLFLLSNPPEERLARKYALWGEFHLLVLLGSIGGVAYLLGA